MELCTGTEETSTAKLVFFMKSRSFHDPSRVPRGTQEFRVAPVRDVRLLCGT